VIPAEIRRQLGFQPGVEVILNVADGELRIRSVRQAIERARELVRRHVGEGTSLADELISERHEAARLE
jgi:AbrB family looped-hinge helix DNA binding protein